jgi:putative membrane protein
VLEKYPGASLHLVSDGAEDEFLFPILASRARIDGVHRLYIRQSASIESTYYTLVRALKDPKLRAKTVLPFAIVLLVLGLAAAGGVIVWGIIGLSVLLGIYLIFWTFDIDEAIIDSVRSASNDIRQGSVAFGFGIFSMALVGAGFLTGYNIEVAHPADSPLARLLLFLNAALIWWLFGGLVWEGGRALRRYFVRGRFPRSFPIATTSIIGIGFVAYGVVFLVQYLESLAGPQQLLAIVSTIVIGLSLVIAAAVLSQYLKTRTPAPEPASTPS